MSAGTPAEQGRLPRPRASRDRPHRFPGRTRGVNARFTDDEYDELATAAETAGLTPTGFCAQAALDVARGLHTNTAERVERESLGSLQAELFQARTTLNQLRTELARHLDTVNPTTAHLDETIAGATHSLTALDNVITRIHHQLERN